MHTEILTADQLLVLDRLSSVPGVAEFYLAGGTALALRHGHRRSVDFDFFRPDDFDTFELAGRLETCVERYEQLPSGEHTLHVRLEGVSASFFRLPYPLLREVDATPWGFGLADDIDIAAMKLDAVAGRGSRKDFVDLHLLCRSGLSLQEIFTAFEQDVLRASTNPMEANG